jgi:hypothetical protein
MDSDSAHAPTVRHQRTDIGAASPGTHLPTLDAFEQFADPTARRNAAAEDDYLFGLFAPPSFAHHAVILPATAASRPVRAWPPIPGRAPSAEPFRRGAHVLLNVHPRWEWNYHHVGLELLSGRLFRPRINRICRVGLQVCRDSATKSRRQTWQPSDRQSRLTQPRQ